MSNVPGISRKYCNISKAKGSAIAMPSSTLLTREQGLKKCFCNSNREKYHKASGRQKSKI